MRIGVFVVVGGFKNKNNRVFPFVLVRASPIVGGNVQNYHGELYLLVRSAAGSGIMVTKFVGDSGSASVRETETD